MRHQNIIALLLAIVLIPLGGLALAQMDDPGSYEGCGRFDNAIAALESERRMAATEVARQAIDTRIAEVRQQADDDDCVVASTPATPTETATAEPTETPSDEPDAEPTDTPSTPPGDEELTFPHFFFFDGGKIGARDFGPPITGGNTEWQERLSLDPSLLCTTVVKVNEKLNETGDSLVSLPGGNMLDCTKTLAANQTLHDAIHDELNEKMGAAEDTIKDPGVVNSTYMVEVDDVPASYDIKDVHRPESYEVGVVQLSNGLTLEVRWLCGGQIQDDVPAAAAEQPPAGQPSSARPTDGVTAPAVTPTDGATTPVVVPTTEPTEEPTEEPTSTPTETTPTTPVTPTPTETTPTTPVTPTPTETTPTTEVCPPLEDGTVPPMNPDGTCPKDESDDPQEQGNLPPHLGDGDDSLPTAEGCVNGGIRDRDGVCELPEEPAVEAPAPTATHTQPSEPAPTPAPDVTPIETTRPIESPAPDVPPPGSPEVGGEDVNDGDDNAFGETEGG